MVAKRRKSKKMTLKKKYMIEKKVRAHKKKQKKIQRKQPELLKKKPKDPGVPKTLPFYDKIIEEARQAKEAKLQQIKENQERRKELKAKMLANTRSAESINEMIQTAEKRGAEFEERMAAESSAQGTLTDRSAKAYYKEFKKVVEAADVILEVLDARDPLGSRVPQMEASVTCHANKKLVLVLNKADLVPRDVLEKWLQYLRREYPTVLFKSSTQTQGSHLGQNAASTSSKVLKVTDDLMTSSKALGAEVLMQLLKNYCRNKDIKTAITVGVVGLPNVGKSSLINSLKRSKACGVGATPGFTKTLQQVQLDSKVQLIDCPGIILPGGDTSDANAALRNAVKLEQLDDPITPVEAIFARAQKSQLMVHYRLPEFQTVVQFLTLLAKRHGKLKKGGIPDRVLAARKVLHDWNIGAIKYYTQPPDIDNAQVGAALVSQLGKEFDMDSLSAAEGTFMDTLPVYRPSQTMAVQSAGPLMEIREHEEMESGSEDEAEDEEEEMEMETEEAGAEVDGVLPKGVHINMDTKSNDDQAVAEKRPRWENPMQAFDPDTMSLKKYQKKAQKKHRKETNRNVKRADDLTNMFQNFTGMKEDEDDYDFNEYFK